MSVLLLPIQASGRLFYASADACLCIASDTSLKGRLLFKECIFLGLKTTQALAELSEKKCTYLNIVVAQFEISDPFFSKIGKTLIAWGSLTKMVQTNGLTKPFGFTGYLLKSTACSLSLLQYFDKCGTHSIHALIQFDDQFCGGCAAAVGQSTVFRVLGMQTLKGFQNNILIVSNLCVIIQAIKTYQERPTTPLEGQELRTTKQRKQYYAKQILLLTVGREVLKITLRLSLAGTPLGTCLGLALLATTVSRSLFKIYYIGEDAIQPRTLHYCEWLKPK